MGSYGKGEWRKGKKKKKRRNVDIREGMGREDELEEVWMEEKDGWDGELVSIRNELDLVSDILWVVKFY